MAVQAQNLRPQAYNPIDLASLYLRTANLPDTALNRRMLAGWFWAESAHSGSNIIAYNNNPLNITTSSSDYHQFANNKLHFANYASPQEGAKGWANLLATNSSYRGIVTAFQVQDSRGLPSAIGKSPWGTSASGVQAGISAMGHFSADVTTLLPTASNAGTSGGGSFAPGISPVSNGWNQATIDKARATMVGLGIDPNSSTYRLSWNDAVEVARSVLGTNNPNVVNPVAQALMGQNPKTLLSNQFNSSQFTAVPGPAGQLQQGLTDPLANVGAFFGSLTKSNILHVAAIPAGAILIFFGARILLAQSGVSTSASGGGGGTQVVQTRAYPVIIRGS